MRKLNRKTLCKDRSKVWQQQSWKRFKQKAGAGPVPETPEAGKDGRTPSLALGHRALRIYCAYPVKVLCLTLS